jgi:signal transduction histidine kinase/ActR/RegA family two-component response regulator
MYHPEDVPRVRAAISAHLKGQTKHFAVEYRMRHSTGDWHWYRQRGVAIRDASGRAYRMAGSMEDITERKRTEIAKEALETQLRQAQKLEAMGTLAGGIAHDFNNILAAILGYGEMAQKRLEEGTAVRQHVDSVMSAGLRAKSLVERILAFSRSGIGDRVPVHAQSTVGEALDLVAASIPAGVRLERDLDCGDAAVIGDPTQLHQVVVNLATNAIQAIKSQGTVRVSLATVALTTPQHVCTTTIAPGAYVCLTVADSGAGIAPEIIERIFDPFFTTKQFGIGTGLGLSLVHGIVTDLGGGIGVESRLDAGTTFLVYLPVRGTTVPARQVVDTVPNGEGQTILVVDDEEALVRLSEEMLAGIGYEPVCFTSAARALERFRADPQRFDAVVTDEMMPGMTGSELARAIRAIRADIPIVLVSGYLSPLVLARVKAAGVAEVLAKPLVSRDIAKSLARVLRPTPPRAAAVGE